jgi:hypothetical protein
MATYSSIRSAIDLTAVDQNIIPNVDSSYNLGSPTHKWKDMYLSGGTLHIGGVVIKEDVANPGKIKFEDSAGTSAFAAGGGIEKDYRYNGILYPQNGSAKLYMTSTTTLNEVIANLEIAPSGGDVDLRLNKNGSSAATLTIADSSTTTTITPNISFVSGDYITVDITSVGTSTAGTNLYMALKFS